MNAQVLVDALLAHLTQEVTSGGMHTAPALRLLLLALARALDGPVLETGYDAGFTTLALALSGADVTGLDDLSEYGGVDSRARELLAPYPNVALLRTDALGHLCRLPDDALALAFIDDAHTPAHVEMEARELQRVLRPGGVAVFHDTRACGLLLALRRALPTWPRITLPAVSPVNGLDYGCTIVQKPEVDDMGAIAELAAYLVKKYEPGKLVWPPGRLEKELTKHRSDWRAFVRDKEALYLYARREDNDEWWLPHLQFLREVLAERRPESVLDVHALTGWMGIRAGATAFADDAGGRSKSTDFLRWRIKRHGLRAQVYDLGKDAIPRHDLAFAFDAAHFYDEPWELVERLAGLGRLVVLSVNSREVDAPALVAQVDEAYRIIKLKTVNATVSLLAFETPQDLDGAAPEAEAADDEIENEEQ